MDDIGWELGAKTRKIRLGVAGIFAQKERFRGRYGLAVDVRFAPESGRKWVWCWMSAFDP